MRPSVAAVLRILCSSAPSIAIQLVLLWHSFSGSLEEDVERRRDASARSPTIIYALSNFRSLLPVNGTKWGRRWPEEWRIFSLFPKKTSMLVATSPQRAPLQCGKALFAVASSSLLPVGVSDLCCVYLASVHADDDGAHPGGRRLPEAVPGASNVKGE